MRGVILALQSVAAVSNVRAILTPDPPPILYHYTTPAGLLGIIDKREIWASHTQYLNDQREFQHAVSIIEEEIASMKKTPQHDKHQDLLDEMASVLKDSGSMNVCVCSFSEKGDVLSQWRAYGGGSGFSIGLSGPFLRTVAVSQRFWLVKCIYEEVEQRSWLRTLLTDVLNENTQKELDGGDDGDPKPGGNLGASCLSGCFNTPQHVVVSRHGSRCPEHLEFVDRAWEHVRSRDPVMSEKRPAVSADGCAEKRTHRDRPEAALC